MADRIFHQFSASLARNHQAGANLTQFDHVRNLHNAVEQPKTCVRDIVDQAVPLQFQSMMDAARRGRFKEIAADRSMNERSNFATISSSGFEGLASA
jgi:hypothetical protein